MASTFYDVEIAAILAAAPSDGFIDPKTVELYLNESTVPTDYDGAVAKERANRRFEYLVGQVQQLGNAYFTEITTTGADVDTPPSKIAFRIEFEHGDEYVRTVSAASESAPGTVLEGADAVKRALARALMIAEIGHLADVYDPAPARPDSTQVRGVRLHTISIGALTSNLTDAEAAITVTKLV